jgi:sn-glycerol 3-phosphate transport system permease protein
MSNQPEIEMAELAMVNRPPLPSGPRPKTRYGVHLALMGVCFIVAFPMLMALMTATQTAEESFAPATELFPPSTDLDDNVRELFDSENFGPIIWNTLIVTSVVVIAKTTLAMLSGLAFVYFQFPGKWVLFFVVLLSLLLPTEIILLPLFRLVSELEWGSQNPRLALTIPFLATAAGAFLFRQHFTNIPREMVEAAQMDGATPLRFMWSVLIPMSMNVIMAHAVLQFIAAWNQFLWPALIIQNREDWVIQQGVRNAARFSSQSDFGLLMTAGIVASIPPVIIFILLQKQFMSGFALTRDK